MATVQLRRGSDTIDLYGGTDGYKVRYDGWMPAVAAQTQDGTWEVVDEILTLRVDGSSTTDLASKIQSVDQMLYNANRYINRAFYAEDPVFLRVKLDGESKARQTLIYNGMTEPRVGFLGPPFTNLHTAHEYKLGLTRHPFWETTTPTNAFSGYDIAHYGTLSTTGGTAQYNTVGGDVPARVNSLYFGAGLAGTGNYYECWAGFRSNAFGTFSNFEPRWDLGDSDISGSDFMNTDTSRTTGVSGAYNSQVARCDFSGDTTLQPRATAPLFHMTSNYTDQRGTYLVLLRARITSGGDRTCNVRLASGYYDSSNVDGSTSSFRTGSRVRVPESGVSAGNWYYYPLGIVNIPPHRQTYAKVSLLRYFALRVEAEVNSGSSGSLDMDMFTLIPIAEGGVHVKGTYLDTLRTVFVATSSDDEIFAHNTTGGGAWADYHKGVQFDPYNWSVPTGLGQVVVAAQEETSQTLTNTMQCWFDHFPRWKTLRG